MSRTAADLTTLLTHRPELTAAPSLDLLERMLAGRAEIEGAYLPTP